MEGAELPPLCCFLRSHQGIWHGNREALWDLLNKLGSPAKFVSIIRAFHDGMCATVSAGGKRSDLFIVTNGVTQGCILARLLFVLCSQPLLIVAMSQTIDGSCIRFWTTGKFFHLRRLQATNNVVEELNLSCCTPKTAPCSLIPKRYCRRCQTSFQHQQQSSFFSPLTWQKTEVMHQRQPNDWSTPAEANI